MKDPNLSFDYLRALLENMIAVGQLATRNGQSIAPSELVSANESALLDVIRSSFPLSHVLATSDLVLHAEGPSLHDVNPSLAAFNWLSGTTERALRKLSGELFSLSERDSRSLGSKLDLRLTGMAPGSLYLGFALAEPRADLIPAEDEPVYRRVREAVRQLPTITSAIEDEGLSPEMAELIPDPAERDATLGVLRMMAPTGRAGIHTVDMASPGRRRAMLSQRERVVLNAALSRPRLENHKQGRFYGEVREVNLDTRRFHLRVPALNASLRCVWPKLSGTAARKILAKDVIVDGQFETDDAGRPRLMIVDEVTKQETPRQRRLRIRLGQ